MSCILYHSKYCEVSKKYIQILSKSQSQTDIHFICIDKRIKDENNKTYIILENGQKIILPEICADTFKNPWYDETRIEKRNLENANLQQMKEIKLKKDM